MEALRCVELPSVYLEDEPNVYESSNGHLVTYSGGDKWCRLNDRVLLCRNGFIEEQEFQKRLVYIERAGERLASINRSFRKKRNDWKGEETFEI